MARDYKHRAQPKKPAAKKASVAWWKWLLVVMLITLFVVFLTYLRDSAPDHPAKPSTKKTIETSKAKKTPPPKPKHQDNKAKEPRYDFYTILPEAEVVVPDYEIKTRAREERVGKAKATRYMIQAGSFRDFAEADKLRARLALMGIESRVEKARIGNTTWNRVKMGPFTRSSSVSSIKERLRQNDIDVIVTEQEG
ncbi:SPOR domain-containing protein [Methylomarinum sp. Ch1-1]|uniref:SPOR domain-containing protein n=1 Tax=Methylomarinum roseum TaxID=3067653 RepID=A0AAU7NWZ8_9GAMM|nr:SPOR domain-containing protein [Methylomarinum sp. Ch1-1]MDP4522805.1 SPOR domain-containing protein [Methylomarinum sp. Ch1-1]